MENMNDIHQKSINNNNDYYTIHATTDNKEWDRSKSIPDGVEPLTCQETMWQPFLSCGLCQDEIEQDLDSSYNNNAQENKEEVETDWGQLLWNLSGMEFLRIACEDAKVIDDTTTIPSDSIIVSAMGGLWNSSIVWLARSKLEYVLDEIFRSSIE